MRRFISSALFNTSSLLEVLITKAFTPSPLPSVLFKKDILDKESLIVTIEAGNVSSWNKYLGDKGISVGIEKFGESAPYKEVYEHLNLSVEKIVFTIQENLRKLSKF